MDFPIEYTFPVNYCHCYEACTSCLKAANTMTSTSDQSYVRTFTCTPRILYTYLPVEFSLRTNTGDTPTAEDKYAVIHGTLVMGGESGEGG